MTRCAALARPLLLVFGAAATVLACSDSVAPLDPSARAAVAAAQPNKPKGPTPKLRMLDLSSTTLTIGGASVPYTVTIQNSGPPRTSIILQGEIVQGAASRGAGSTNASCPIADGTLPNGSCTMGFTATASNAAGGTGTLVAGPATFVLKLVQADGVNPEVVLDTRSTAVTLLAGPVVPRITSLSVSTNTLEINGAAASFTATLQNDGPPRDNIYVLGRVEQGGNSAVVGGTYVGCPTFDKVLPTGTCTLTIALQVSTTVPGGAGLVPGAATISATLYFVENDVLNPLDSRSVPVTLVAPPAGPTITNLTLSTTTLVIGGESISYDVTVTNPGAPLSDIFVQGEMLQNGNTAGAAGFDVRCPPLNINGDLPSGTCTMTLNTLASNTLVFPSPLVPGPAVFRLTLYNAALDVLDTESVAVTLVAGPSITSVVFADPDNVLISLTVTAPYTVTIENAGPGLTDVGIQGEIIQDQGGGVVATRGAGGFPVLCSVSAFGILPTGTCTMTTAATVHNNTGGTGDLREGPATFKLTLDHNGVVLDTKSVPITLRGQLF